MLYAYLHLPLDSGWTLHKRLSSLSVARWRTCWSSDVRLATAGFHKLPLPRHDSKHLYLVQLMARRAVTLRERKFMLVELSRAVFVIHRIYMVICNDFKNALNCTLTGRTKNPKAKICLVTCALAKGGHNCTRAKFARYQPCEWRVLGAPLLLRRPLCSNV